MVYGHFMLGVVGHKNVYNSCPLKYEAVNLLVSGEMLYYEDPKFFQCWEETCNKIQYNTLSSYYFHDLAEAGIPMLSFVNSFSCT